MGRILIAEDDNSLRENISLLLSSEGHEVVSAGDGLEALNCLETFNPELIISDIMMPRMDGIELFKTLKKENKVDFIPFIFLTAKVDLNNIREGMNLGADDYLTKPFKSKDLLSTVDIRLKKSYSHNNRLEALSKNIALYVPHELRTPLVSILGYSEILKEEYSSLSNNQVVEMLDSINYSGQRLLERIEKFILYSELLTTDVKNNSSPNEFCNILSSEIEIDITQYLREEMKEREVKFNISEAVVKIPQRYVNFILRELIQNALKFSPKDTNVLIEGRVNNSNYILTVTDHGYGLSKNQIQEISPFRQFDRQKHQQVGNGLGLVIIKRIIDIFSGSINIDSVTGNGTIITVSFPQKENN